MLCVLTSLYTRESEEMDENHEVNKKEDLVELGAAFLEMVAKENAVEEEESKQWMKEFLKQRKSMSEDHIMIDQDDVSDGVNTPVTAKNVEVEEWARNVAEACATGIIVSQPPRLPASERVALKRPRYKTTSRSTSTTITSTNGAVAKRAKNIAGPIPVPIDGVDIAPPQSWLNSTATTKIELASPMSTLGAVEVPGGEGRSKLTLSRLFEPNTARAWPEPPPDFSDIDELHLLFPGGDGRRTPSPPPWSRITSPADSDDGENNGSDGASSNHDDDEEQSDSEEDSSESSSDDQSSSTETDEAQGEDDDYDENDNDDDEAEGGDNNGSEPRNSGSIII